MSDDDPQGQSAEGPGDGLLGAGAPARPVERRHESGGVGLRGLLITASFVIVVAGMRAAQPILVPFLLALFLSVVCGPPLSALRRLGLPVGLSVAVVIGGLALFGLLVAGLVGRSAQDFERSLPELQQRMSGALEHMQDWLAEQGLLDAGGDAGAPPDHEDPEALPVDDSPNLDRRDMLARVVEGLDLGAVFRRVNDLVAQLVGMLANTFLILLTVVFVLLEAAGFPAKLRRALRDPEAFFEPFTRFVDDVNRYMAMKSALSLLTGVLAWVWLAALGIDYPLLWGLLAFLLNFVPNLGSLLAAVPPVLLALVQQHKGFGSALLVLIGYLAINIGVGSFLEPRLMGRKLGLSTLVVFLSLVFWGWVLGPVGMLLSVPLTMTVKIGLEVHGGTRWIAVLLGSDSGRPESAASEANAASDAGAGA